MWDAIDAGDREILYLWAVEEYSAAEIGHVLDVPRNTILSRVHRLRARLRDAFPEHVEEVS